MDDLAGIDVDDVRARATDDGFDLEERVVAGAWVWGWARGEDTRWPCFRTIEEAARWMDDRLRRSAIFE